ncbi:unnamed protein product [Clavelina lepadiformis]|uniref:Uncharacterized protein n=1 Tax=Clavelina lepadiformis TaxID=159417 RepID=A0ABP0FD40_CLALP
MDQAQLLLRMETLKREVTECRRTRDDLLRLLVSSGKVSAAHQPPSYQTKIEELREKQIRTWKEIERKERLYRIQARGLEAKVKVLDEQLYWLQTH